MDCLDDGFASFPVGKNIISTQCLKMKTGFQATLQENMEKQILGCVDVPWNLSFYGGELSSQTLKRKRLGC